MNEDWREELAQRPKRKKDDHGLPELGSFVVCRNGFRWQVQSHVMPKPKGDERPRPPKAHVTAPREHGDPSPVWRRVTVEQIKNKDFGYKPWDFDRLRARGVDI